MSPSSAMALVSIMLGRSVSPFSASDIASFFRVNKDISTPPIVSFRACRFRPGPSPCQNRLDSGSRLLAEETGRADILPEPSRTVANSDGPPTPGSSEPARLFRHYGDALRIDRKIARDPGVGVSSVHLGVSNE